MAPSTDRTPPAGTLPPLVSNVRFANSLMGFRIEPARVGPRSRRGMLSTITEPLKTDPVPLGASQIPTHKPSRRCVASVKCASAPLGATHDTNATQPTTSTTAPPYQPPTSCAGGSTRAAPCEADYLSRDVVVVVSSVVRSGRSGTTPNAPTSRKSGARSRAEVKLDLERTRFPLFRTCLVAFKRRPGRREHYSYLGRS